MQIQDRKQRKYPPANQAMNVAMTHDVWRHHYLSWQGSRLSKAVYCRQQGLNADNFYYWCKRFERQVKSNSDIHKAAQGANRSFVEVTLKEPEKSRSTVDEIPVIVDCNGVRLQFQLDIGQLVKVIKEIGDAATFIR